MSWYDLRDVTKGMAPGDTTTRILTRQIARIACAPDPRQSGTSNGLSELMENHGQRKTRSRQLGNRNQSDHGQRTYRSGKDPLRRDTRLLGSLLHEYIDGRDRRVPPFEGKQDPPRQ